jgi:hypothetical protein
MEPLPQPLDSPHELYKALTEARVGVTRICIRQPLQRGLTGKECSGFEMLPDQTGGALGRQMSGVGENTEQQGERESESAQCRLL